MQNIPKTSVIVPIYNKELFLRKCISSILEQTEKNIEMILVDDGSTDNSSKICKEFAEKDSRILYKRKENGGLTSARNYGRRYASGDYIAFVDPDDYIDAETFEQMLKNSNNADIIIGGLIHETGKKRAMQIMPKALGNFYEGENIRKIILPLFLIYEKHPLLAQLGIFLFKRKFLEEKKIISDESITYSEDWLFSLEALLKSKSVAIQNKAHYHYVHNSLGLTENYNPKVAADYIKILQKLEKFKIFSYIPEHYSANPNLAFNFFLQIVKNLSLKKASIFSLSNELRIFFEEECFRNLGNAIKACKVPFKKRILFYLVKYKCSLFLILMYRLKSAGKNISILKINDFSLHGHV
jgi:glycosyltransferase involved in cell wall biosynthesis